MKTSRSLGQGPLGPWKGSLHSGLQYLCPHVLWPGWPRPGLAGHDAPGQADPWQTLLLQEAKAKKDAENKASKDKDKEQADKVKKERTAAEKAKCVRRE